MTPEIAIRTRLLTVTTSANDRIYPIRMPPTHDQVFPLIVYQRISAPRIYAQDGDALLPEPRIQLSCWDDDYDGVAQLRDEVVTALSGWRDESLGVQHCLIAFELDQWEEQSGLYKKMVDAQVGWKGY